MKALSGFILFFIVPLAALATESPVEPLKTGKFVFELDGRKLVGLFDTPTDREAAATIVIVHGYGKTNVVKQSWFYDLRSRFAKIGINTLVWDKPGCGESEGVFDIDQSVQSSAKEVVAAITALRKSGAAGTKKIGLWGISRAGWIAPLAIQADPSIAFWISVSGTDDKENFRYLLESNFPIEGRSEAETRMLVAEWQRNFNLLWKGGTFEESQHATPNLDKDPFMNYLSGRKDGDAVDVEADRNKFLTVQKKFQSGEWSVDKKTELMVYVPQFRKVLNRINCPVLALFGEKDTNVDWRITKQLYSETIGRNSKASLTVKVFPDANHNIKQCKTGGVREMSQMAWDTPYAEGYYETMVDWLVELGYGKKLVQH